MASRFSRPIANTGGPYTTAVGVAVRVDGSASHSQSGGAIVKYRWSWGDNTSSTTSSPQTSHTYSTIGKFKLSLVVTDSFGASSKPASSSVTVTPGVVLQPPNVSITDPVDGEVFIAPTDISITAVANDTDGTVTSVAIYDGVNLLTSYTSPPYTYLWTNVPVGTYSIYAVATDNDGLVTTSFVISVEVVSPSPTVSITSPADAAIFTAPATVNITANAADVDGTISSVKFYVNAVLLDTDTSAPYSATTGSLSAGTYVLTAVATDNAAQETTSAPVTIIVNPARPVVTMTSPAAGSSTPAPAAITVSATATDADGTISQVEFFKNGSSIGVDTSSPYSIDLTNQHAGTYVFSATATDNSGLTTQSNPVQMTVTPSYPTVTITSPTNGTSIAAPASFSVNASASAADGTITQVEFFENGTSIGVDTTAAYSVSRSNLPAGTYLYTAVATDSFGFSTTSAGVTVSVYSNVPPTVSMTSPSDGATFNAPATITLSATASDPDGTITSVKFYNGTTLLNTDTTSPYSFSWANVPAGSYTLSAVATDNSGDTTQSASISITVNPPANVPPTVSITSPTNGSTFAAPANITITASAADSDGSVASVKFYNGTTLLFTDTVAPYSFIWASVPAGTYNLTAVATDNSGATTQSAIVQVTVYTTPPAPGGRVQAANMVYEGAFRVPTIGSTDQSGYSYGGQALCYNPTNNSLYLAGFWGPSSYAQKVGEISVPNIINGSLSSLATAANLQSPVDITEGKLLTINPGDPNAHRIGGVLPFGNSLAVTGWSYYDGAATQVLSHLVSGTNFSITGDTQGFFQVGGAIQGHNPAGFIAGYMAKVPLTHQSSLGGAYATGQSCIAILSRTSSGPSLFTFNPSLLGTTNPVPATALVYYDINHQTLGGQYSQNALFNGDVEICGVVIPEGWRSVLFFGRRGANYCYGAGTSNFALDGTPVPGQPGVIYCYDPEDGSKGSHSWPKEYYVWAYDVNDLAEVVAGTKFPWQVVPYATWSLSIPYSHASTHIYGAAYDPAHQRIFLSQGFADGAKPVIHTYTLQ